MKNYWLIFESYVHISFKRNGCFIYNTLNAEFLIIEPEEDLFYFLEKNKDDLLNSYIVSIDSKQLESSSTSKFIKQVRTKYIGDVIGQGAVKQKPFQVVPIVKDSSSISPASSIKKYLTTLSIYVNNACQIGCRECQNAHKQFIFCKNKAFTTKELNYYTLELFLKSVDNVVHTVNILGGDILKYSKKKELLGYLLSRKKNVILYVHYSQLEKFLPLVNQYSNLNCKVLFNELNTSYVLPININNSRFEYIFLARNEVEVDRIESYSTNNKISNFTIYPYYTGNNIDFFESNVYLNYQEINDIKPSQDDIVANELINRNNFGKISIEPNGDVYSNFNFPVIGNLSSSSSTDLIYKALVDNKAWRLSRKDLSPCNECIYELICPPPQNYETIIKPNLCTIIKVNGVAENHIE